jgi:hypothetical protein
LISGGPVLLAGSDAANDVEILVLGHQIIVFQAPNPKPDWAGFLQETVTMTDIQIYRMALSKMTWRQQVNAVQV